MNPIVFAMRRPFTVMVLVVAVALGSVLAVNRMSVDIFPNLNLPVVYVCQPYGGMDPAQMEGLLTNYYEYHFLYISGIHHVESRNVQGMALMKLYFHPGTNMAQAMAETIGYVTRSRAFMPPGTVSPFITRFDAGQRPGRLSRALERDQVDRRDPGPGAFQGPADVREPAGRVGPAAVRRQPAHGRRPGRSRPAAVLLDVARRTRLGLDERQHDQPLGKRPHRQDDADRADQRAGPRRQGTGDIPIRPGENPAVYLRDVATVEDASDIPAGYALVNGRRAVYILVTKRADASTLSVVNNVKDALPKMQAVLPDDIKVSFEFDQSPTVTSAVRSLATEGALGALLTGLMVLVFLRDWRSVIVVVLNIPFAICGRDRGTVAHGPDDQPDDPGRAGLGGRHPRGRGDRRNREHSPQDRRHRLGRLGRAPGKHGHRRSAAAGDALHPGRFHAVVLHAGGGPGAVRAAVAGGRLCDGLLLSAVEHIRAGALDVAARATIPYPRGQVGEPCSKGRAMPMVGLSRMSFGGGGWY